MKSAEFRVAVVVLLIAQIEALVTPLGYYATQKESSTELMGLRSFVKRKLTRPRNSISNKPPKGSNLIEGGSNRLLGEGNEDSFSGMETGSDSIRSARCISVPYMELTSTTMAVTSATDVLQVEQQRPPRASTTMTLERRNDEDDMDVPQKLPPIGDRDLTKLETEFREMLGYFSQYTRRDIMAVRDPRMRIIFQGVAASYGLPEVYRAFEILFEDYAPLRVAGRLIYGKLKDVMEEAQRERRREVDTVSERTGLSRGEVEASRSAYFKLVVHEDDTATEMTLQQIVDFGLAEMAVELLGYRDFDDFVKSLNPCRMQKVDFERLMIALQSCPIDDPSPECNPSTVLKEIAGRLETRTVVSPNNPRGQKQGKLNERYDGMVERFREWKSLVPNGDGRRLEILRGCFVGAESAEIVEALRVVYIDYSALRMSGDLIFKVMATLVGRKGS